MRIILEFSWTNRGNHRKLQLGYPAFQLRFEPRTAKYEVADQWRMKKIGMRHYWEGSGYMFVIY